MYCSACGKRIDDTVKFCNFCGQKVGVVEKKVNSEVVEHSINGAPPPTNKAIAKVKKNNYGKLAFLFASFVAGASRSSSLTSVDSTAEIITVNFIKTFVAIQFLIFFILWLREIGIKTFKHSDKLPQPEKQIISKTKSWKMGPFRWGFIITILLFATLIIVAKNQ